MYKIIVYLYHFDWIYCVYLCDISLNKKIKYMKAIGFKTSLSIEKEDSFIEFETPKTSSGSA